MSLRSRTLRARLLRLCRCSLRPVLGLKSVSPRPRVSFAQLVWRRVRVPGVPRTQLLAPRLYHSQWLIRPDIRISWQLHFATAGGTPGRPGVELQFRTGECPRRLPQLPRPPRLSQFLQLQRFPPFPQSLSRPGSIPRSAASALVPVQGPMSGAARLGAVRTTHITSLRHNTHAAAVFHRVVHERSLVRALHGPRKVLHELIVAWRTLDFPRRRQSPMAATPPAHFKAPGPAVPLAYRPGAAPPPLALHYSQSRTPRESRVETVRVEKTTPVATTASPTAAAITHTLRTQSAVPALDRTLTDRLADEVIRRIERRVRLERERRGL